MIRWTQRAIIAAGEALIGDSVGDNGMPTHGFDIKAALNAAAYEQMRTAGDVYIDAGMAQFYDAGFVRAVEACALRIEDWEKEVGVAEEARGRLPALIREIRNESA